MNFIKQFYNPSTVPFDQKSNFGHFLFDIGWFGVLSGSTANFINIYATRIGASEFQIGILSAIAAVVSLFFTIPATRWLEQREIKGAVFWSSIVYRFGFFFFVPLPWLLSQPNQIWALILLSFVMGIPLTTLSIGFSSLFAEAVPTSLRAYFAGTRNVVMAISFMLSSLLCGYLLTQISFPLNYQIVFSIGFIGAMMSSYHLYKIKVQPKENAEPAEVNHSSQARFDLKTYFRADILKTPFLITLLLLMAFHIPQYLAIPLFPIYFVRYLNLTDNQLGIGTALFYLSMLVGSTRLHTWVRSFGNKNMVGIGVVSMAIYPILLSYSTNVWHYYGISLLGGMAWAIVGGTSLNYILDRCPENDRPAHLAWYNLILNASVLIGSLSGPAISHLTSISTALIIFGVLRGLAGLAILKWG
jgi:MFS family permease